MFGKLSLSAIPFDNLITMGALSGAFLLAVLILVLITYYGKWTYLWKEWLTSLDHKKIGIMYIILALVMLLRGFSDAILMRSQQALAAGAITGISAAGSFQPDIHRSWLHYDRLYGNAVSGRLDEYYCTATNRRTRCGISFYEFSQLLADHSRCLACYGISGCRRVFKGRLVRIRAPD